MSDVTVLTIDPDQTVLSFVRRIVTGLGYAFLGARRGEDALRRARESRPDAIILRVALPDMSGSELVSRLREDAGEPATWIASGNGGTFTRLGPGVSPILLTALRGQERDVAGALELGAINVLFFPFDEAELTGRLGGLLRWARRPMNEGVLNVGPVSVDLERGELIRPQAQPLTASELEILRWLLNPPGRAVTRRQIPVGTERAVDVHVAALRSKLGPAGACIETLRGIGYRFRGAACL